MSELIEDRIRRLGHELPTAPETVGNYDSVTRVGNLVITSGQLPFISKHLVFRGKIGSTLHEHDGYNAAQISTLNALAHIKAMIGDLQKVKRVVRVEGYVNSATGFTGQSQVLNGASELLVEAFGERGRHTRVAIGVNELPSNAAVEVALWVEVAED